MRTWDYDVTEAMIQMGGEFVQALGRLHRLADADNQERLCAAFPEYGERYRELAELKAAGLRILDYQDRHPAPKSEER